MGRQAPLELQKPTFQPRVKGDQRQRMRAKLEWRKECQASIRSRSTKIDSYISRYIFVEECTMIWKRQWHLTPVLLPGESHGPRSLVGCSPWGREESDMTERLHFHFPLSCIGEGNGNPLQCSCLENPRDRGAWWAAVYGVAQSWTWLKRFSSSSTMIWPFTVAISAACGLFVCCWSLMTMGKWWGKNGWGDSRWGEPN